MTTDLIERPEAPPIAEPPMRGLRHLRPPVMGICRNPLEPVKPEDMHEVPVGVRFCDFVLDHHFAGLRVLNVNGRWYTDWTRETKPGDVIVWFDFPQDRESIRTILAIAVIIVSLLSQNYALAAKALPFLIAANLAYNLLVPPRGMDGPEKAGSIFSTGLAGNAARLDQPLWRLMGHTKSTPPFACTPYLDFRATNPDDPGENTDMYYSAVFFISVGEVDLVRALIGKSNASGYNDVFMKLLGPGEQPERVKLNCCVSTEVSGIELTNDDNGDGIYTAAYVCCRPMDRCTALWFNVEAPQGLGLQDNEGDGSHTITVKWQVQIQEIDDFGVPIGEWMIFDDHEEQEETNTPQRWTHGKATSAPIRCQARMYRANVKNKSPGARDALMWTGLRAELLVTDGPLLDQNSTHLEVEMRASEQLSNDSFKDFSVITNAKVRTWHPDTGWGPAIFTRNAAWWLADLWTNPIWGEGLPDDRVDLLGLYNWSLKLDARQDHCDMVVSTARDSDALAQAIARTGRARAFTAAGVRTVTRDEWVDLPTMAFHVRNTQPQSFSLSAALPPREQPDGVIVEHSYHKKWDTETWECPCLGYSITVRERDRLLRLGMDASLYDPLLPEMSRPIYLPLEGVIGPTQARRDGLYMARKLSLRTRVARADTELEGFTVRFMQTVELVPEIKGYGMAGDVAFWDDVNLVATLTERPDFSKGTLYLRLHRPNGKLTDPVAVTPGPGPKDVTLPAAPDFPLLLDDAATERPKFILGTTSGTEIAKIDNVSDGGKTAKGAQLFSLEFAIDDERVHTGDTFLLPKEGEIQDPIDDGTDIPQEGGTATVVRLKSHGVANTFTPTGLGGEAAYRLFADGTSGYMSHLADNPGPVVFPIEEGLYPYEWLNTAPVEPYFAQQYEVLVEDFGTRQVLIDAGTDLQLVGDAVNTWIPLGLVDYEWKLVQPTSGGYLSYTAPLRVSIRRIGGTVILAKQMMTLTMFYNYDSTGP